MSYFYKRWNNCSSCYYIINKLKICYIMERNLVTLSYRCFILTFTSMHLIWTQFPEIRNIPSPATPRVSNPVTIIRMDRPNATLPAWKESNRTGSRSGLMFSDSRLDTSFTDRVPTMIRPIPMPCQRQMYAFLMVLSFPTQFHIIHLRTLLFQVCLL